MRGDCRSRNRPTGLRRPPELLERRGPLLHHHPRAPCRLSPAAALAAALLARPSGFAWMFARLVASVFDRVFAIKTGQKPAIPNGAPSPGFAIRRHLYLHPSRSRPLDSSSAFVALESSLTRALRPGEIATASAPAGQRFDPAPAARRPGGDRAVSGARGNRGPRTRPGRGRARSARVIAEERREVDLDRFVAALLALASETAEECERRRRPTGRTSPSERRCRR